MYFFILYFTNLPKYYVIIYNNSKCGDENILPGYFKIL